MTAATITPSLVTLSDRLPATPKREFEGRHSLRMGTLTGKVSFSPLYPRPSAPKIEPENLDLGVASYSIEPDHQMGLVTVTNSRKIESRSQRGLRGMTKLQRELIEGGLVFLFKLFKQARESLVFWTATVPTHYADGSKLTREDEISIMSGWDEINKRLFEELARELERLGLPQRFLYCIELQDRFMPHVHAIIPNRYEGEWSLKYTTTDEIWGRILSNYLGKSVNISTACTLEPIHSMSKLSDYLTKFGKIASYMSKGSEALKAAREKGLPLPKSWAGSDLETKQSVRDSFVKVVVEDSTITDLNIAIETAENQIGRKVFSKPFLVEIDGVDWYASAIFRVEKLPEINLGLSYLLPLLCDSG